MKEQVARLLAEQGGYEWGDLGIDYTDMYYRRAKEILTWFKEEIEKVENPHRRLDNGYYVGFDDCQKAILKALES